MTIADYCQAFERREVLINRRYQRNPQVWPLQARSYLIETILCGFPIPKLALHQVTDLKSRKTLKHVVDGQQRTTAILDFYTGRLQLGRRLELSNAAGRNYSQLPDELQEDFLSYPLQFDQFEAATEEDVREYFRRINSFTAPLNAEEQRHARYQGPMKWFINSLSRKHGEVFVNLDVLTEKGVIRMADAKLLSEVVHALLNGITTTSKATLNSMYHLHDRGEALENEDELRKSIDEGLSLLVSMSDIQGTALMRTNVFYSLLLAAIYVQSRAQSLQYLAVTTNSKLNNNAAANLLTLAAALDEPEIYEDYREFTAAAAEKTNVKLQREIRVKWLIRALTEATI